MHFNIVLNDDYTVFPISRDPPEGGTFELLEYIANLYGFQFLGIPPKGEPGRGH